MKAPTWWFHKNWQSRLLLPLAWVVAKFSTLRYQKYKKGFMQVWQPPVPTVVVGNITSGGSGKTPMVMYLAELLGKQGYKPMIVSKGYGGSHTKSSKLVYMVSEYDEPQLVGDEPLMMAQKKICPVIICYDRSKAMEFAISELRADCIITDDGMQDYQWQHHIEICMIDGECHLGNAWCLPAGPLREEVSRLNDLTFIVENTPDGKQRFAKAKFLMQLVGDTAVNLVNDEHKSLTWFVGKQALAVAGLGSPQRFFRSLKSQITDIQTLDFPDHHYFQADELPANIPVIMTSKDAVKCKKFGSDNYWEVPVRAVVSQEFVKQFLRKFNHVKQQLQKNKIVV